ncbi:terminase small subunit-like protein [Rhizobium redzepovicii]|uniref:terminase small subunit-like protein n=1 Tax=Rhizobium redzepovicii TaxID=2867518 RepID=UPI0035C6B087
MSRRDLEKSPSVARYPELTARPFNCSGLPGCAGYAERHRHCRCARPLQRHGDVINKRIADGEILRSICGDDTTPAKSTLLAWLADDDNTAFGPSMRRCARSRPTASTTKWVEIAGMGVLDVPALAGLIL